MNPPGDWGLSGAGAANAADPIRMALLQNLEKRTRAQAEYERILAADSQGMVDAGAALAAFTANLTPAGNLGIKALSVLGDPSWKQHSIGAAILRPDRGRERCPSLAAGPVAALIPRGAPVHEQVNLLFNKTQSQMAAVGRKGGLARVRNLLQKQWEKEIAASAKQEAIEYSTSVYKGPQVSSTETTRQAMDKLDALFPWLAGAEKIDDRTEAAPGGMEEAEGHRSGGRRTHGGGRALRAARVAARGRVAMNASTARGGAPLGNLGAMGANSLAGLKAFLGIGGSVQTGPGMATTWQAATMGQKASAMGRSDAALMGGAMLALYGLQRGGKTGVAMTTGGGALIGFKFGGPIGAGVGAWIGFWAGVARLFVKGAQEKAREKIKATYGVDISDNGVLKQIVEMAKQGFGGNLDMAIRSQAGAGVDRLVRDEHGPAHQGDARHHATGLPGPIRRFALPIAGIFQRHGAAGIRWPADVRPDWRRRAAKRRPDCGEHHRAGRQGVLREGDRAGGDREPARRAVGRHDRHQIERRPPGDDESPDESGPADCVTPCQVQSPTPHHPRSCRTACAAPSRARRSTRFSITSTATASRNVRRW